MKWFAYIVIFIGISIGGLLWWNTAHAPSASKDVYSDDQNISEETMASTTPPVSTNAPSSTTMGNPTVTLQTTMGDITIELFMDKMPVTAGNFLKLAEEGFYTNTKFHRVIPNFMIQGGDPLTKDDSQMNRWGTGGPGYTIDDEFVAGLSNVRGTIAMANTGQPHSGGSQFFINTVDNTGLDFDKPPSTSKHPVFGKVVSGMGVVDAISAVARGAADRPNTPIVIMQVVVKK